MANIVDEHEARTRLAELLRRVMSGEEIVITKVDRPIARLTTYSAEPARHTPGNDAGQVMIAPAFDSPLLEFEA